MNKKNYMQLHAEATTILIFRSIYFLSSMQKCRKNKSSVVFVFQKYGKFWSSLIGLFQKAARKIMRWVLSYRRCCGFWDLPSMSKVQSFYRVEDFFFFFFWELEFFRYDSPHGNVMVEWQCFRLEPEYVVLVLSPLMRYCPHQ